MRSFSCETESWVSSIATIQETHDLKQEPQFLTITRTWFDEESEECLSKSSLLKKKEKKKNQVLLEGYVEADSEDDLKRTKSLTDEDLEELKGCLDLGFGFRYEEIPELCNTLSALELCYSMSQKFMDEHQSPKSPETDNSPVPEPVSSPIANWKISSPDRLALLVIKSQLHDPLGVSSSWNVSRDLCQWSGVTCSHRHRRA